MVDININLLSKEQLENNLIIVSIGTENRPATEDNIEDIANGIDRAIRDMKLDFFPIFLITPHSVDIEGSVKIKELKNKKNIKFTRFEIIDI